MIRTQLHGPVTAIRMSHSLFGRPMYWTAAYYVDGLLIDTGPPCTASELARTLDGKPVDRVIITHAHEDHFGGLPQIQQRFPSATVFAPRGAVATLADPTLLHMQHFRRLFWGRPTAVHGVHSLDEIDNVCTTPSYRFHIVATPGHSPDHISLFEPDRRWLFCADAFIGGRDRAWMRDYDMFGVLCSLRTLVSLQPTMLFPGSGVVRTNPVPELHEKIAYYSGLCSQVAQLEAQGLSTENMAEELLGGESWMKMWTRGHFSAANLIEACRSYNTLVSPDCAIAMDTQSISTDSEPFDTIGPATAHHRGLPL